MGSYGKEKQVDREKDLPMHQKEPRHIVHEKPME